MILAVDPGKVTGWAVWTAHGELQAGQCPLQEFLCMADDAINEGRVTEVVAEKFTISKATVTKGADANWSIGGNETLRYWCLRRDVPFTLQTPATAKSFAGDDKLKAMGWYQATTGGHRNDAARHLLTYMVANKRGGQGFLDALRPLLG